jgi:hypothetical protein
VIRRAARAVRAVPPATPAVTPGQPPAGPLAAVPLPQADPLGPPRPIIEQARKDIEAGQQDTDRHATPGLEKPEKWPDQ